MQIKFKARKYENEAEIGTTKLYKKLQEERKI